MAYAFQLDRKLNEVEQNRDLTDSMRKSLRLFKAGDYQGALAALRKEAQRDHTDSLRIGPICEVGAVLICLGEYREAATHFEQLADESLYRVSVHRIYLGLACWYGRKKKQAIAVWEEALRRSQYNHYRGFDIPFLLYFIASTAPKYYSLDAAKQHVRRLYDKYKDFADFDTQTAAYLLDLVDEDRYTLEALDITTGKNILGRIESNRASLQFYAACKAAERGDKKTFRKTITECASASGWDDIAPEFVVAKCEATLIFKRLL